MTNATKYPKAIAGVFIFNENNELLLVKAVKFHNKYSNIGGKIELNETIEQALVREAKEEANLDIIDLEFLSVVDGLGLEKSYTEEDNHFIFIDYKAKAKNPANLKLNKEGKSYKWLKVSEWLKKDEDKFAPYIYSLLKKMEFQAEEADFKNKYKRALADYQNLIKQCAKEKQEFAKYANEQLLYEIIPVFNNLKLAFKHAEKIENSGIAEGINYVIKQFKGALENAGVEEIKTVGEKFDHHTMDAVEGQGKIVVKEVNPGYKLRGKTILPAKVIVGEM